MELTFYGANCLRISSKKAQIVVDDNLEKLGLKSVTKATDISLHTRGDIPTAPSAFMTDMPGEYEVSGITIHGIGARAHMDPEGQQSAVIYVLSSDNTKIAVLGHIHPDITEDQVEEIGHVDVAVVPVGNSGYTLDGIGALQVIKKIEPKVVIPTHYADKAIKYEVPQAELADGLKGLAMEPSETIAKYKPVTGELSDATKLIILERQ